ncbi:CocE/NonD family hydrolase [Mycobacterium sp. NAZ190054]|uniref:CocE/NonD family hydrolase n=1 Tax=Mycobacterium sp. NAZ190054 TaxID=1747766 RepID=UPI00079A3688|nr:CocE/NonD family hydrolase [Mycobacterium sp. NAZ190054]KWX69175.1 peptidase S15 [Mycobacterium sp. NAZ190054]
MGAGAYVGRVGGLAVALGIGAAVFTGAGVAQAEAIGGGSESETSQSAETSSTSAQSADKVVDEKTSGAEESEAGPPAEEPVEELVQEPVDEEEPADEDRKPSSPDVGDDVPEVADETVDEAEEPADEVVVDEEAPAAEVTEEPPVTEPVGEEPVTEPVVEPAAGEAEPDPVQTETRELSDAAVPDLPAEEPEMPDGALASLVMSVLAAGREATNETPQSMGDQVTTSLAADEYPIPTDVVVEDFKPPFEWLQHIPVLGRFVVTPLVHLAHAVPFVGEFLHPLIGWPVDHDAAPDDPKPRTVRVTSFDGAKIYVHFMPATGLKAGQSAPTVLSGPGLGLPGATTLGIDIDGFLPYDVVGVGMLRRAGYNVVTWDPRGEWHSEGTMFLDSPDYEGRDVSHIISWLSTLEAVEKVGGDPKVGMVGASYGGGIQLAAASIDRRIDAIVPTIAWNNLTDVLFPREAVASGWGTLLPTVLALTLAREHPRIFPVAIAGVLFGYADPDDIALVESLGYHDQLQDITIPTLLIQGTVDTLFTLDQAHRNALALIEAGTTTKVLWYCGGHGACLSSYNDGRKVWGETLEWLDRYVKGEDVETGPQFEWVDQNGVWHSSSTYPVGSLGAPIEASRDDHKTLLFVPFIGGSGPNPGILLRGLVRTLVGLPSAAPALNAVNLRVPDVEVETQIVGAPELTLTYSGSGTAEHVYAQIVDDQTGLVLGNLATPIPVVLDGESHTVTFSLEQVAHTLKPGQSVTVQIVTSAFAFLNFYSWGHVTVEGMSIKLPTIAAAAAAAESAAA